MGTISDKTTYLNTTKIKIREKINDLGQDLDEEDTFRSYAEALEQVWNEYPKVTATDVEEASLDGTKKGRMEIDLKGQEEQEQLSGKNILNATAESYTLPATSNTYQAIVTQANKPYLEAGTKYYISYNIENASTSNTRSTPRLYLNGEYVQYATANVNLTAGRKVWEFTPSVSGNYEVQYWLQGSNVAVTVSQFMISTSSDTTYEPYCGGIPSPNPGYPQPIKNVTGNANVKIQNKNLAKTTDCNIEETNANYKCTNGLIEINVSARDKCYDICGGIVTGVYLPTYANSNDYHLTGKDEATYKISFPDIEKAITGSFNTILNVFTNKRTIASYIPSTGSIYGTTSFTLQEEEYVKSIYIWVNGANSNINIKTHIQLERGSTATSYVPHQEQNLPFTFAEGQFLADDGKLQENGIYNEFQKIIFDGTENVLTYEAGDDYDGFAIKIKNTYLRNAGDRTSQKYNYFIELGHSPAYGRQPNKATMGTDGYLYVFFKKNVMADVTAVKTWLANNYANNKPLIAIGKVQNPTPIPYNSTQQAQYNAIKQARSYNDQTNISSESDELGFKMDVESLSNGVSSSNTRTLALGSLNQGSLNNIKEVDTEDTEVAQDAEDETSVESEE